MELKWLLMWLLFGFIKGKKTGVCPSLPPTEFADVTAEMYPPQTKLYYTCDPGYDRKASEYLGIQCKIEQQGAVWIYQQFKCFEQKDLSSVDPMMELELTQKPEREPQSPAPQKQEDLSESKQKDFCGPPKTVPHAFIRLPQQHYVGQVLHFKCQTGYDKRPPTFGSRTCKEVNGKTFWTPLDMRCTNNSNQWPLQTIGPEGELSDSTLGTALVLERAGFLADFVLITTLVLFFIRRANSYKNQKFLSLHRFDSSILFPFLIRDTASHREDFSEICGIQMQTREINDLPQKKPDCTSDPKTSSGKQGGSLDMKSNV